MKLEEISLSELISKWQDTNRAWHFEGTGGVKSLERLLGAIGYKQGNYLGYGHEIANFLSDNPGAMEAIINWIGEQDSDEWKNNIISELPENESEDEAEENNEDSGSE
jgi:hypothetical protein